MYRFSQFFAVRVYRRFASIAEQSSSASSPHHSLLRELNHREKCFTFIPNDLDVSDPDQQILVSVSDNIAIKDWPLTCSSPALGGYTAAYDADIVKKLRSIDNKFHLIGKTGMTEFGFGEVWNAIGSKSSILGEGCSGAAVSVTSAEGICDLAISSDMQGCSRIPAALYQCYALKPSSGRLSQHGLVTLCPSLDSVSMLSLDLLLLMTAFHRLKDDPQSYDGDVLDSPGDKELPPSPTIGIIRQFEANAERLAETLSHCYDVKILDLPDLGGLVQDVHNVLLATEAADFIHLYGRKNPVYLHIPEDLLGDAIKQKISFGKRSSQNEHALRKALGRRDKLRDLVFKDVDIILGHTIPSMPSPGAFESKPELRAQLVLANLMGCPALTSPGNMSDNPLDSLHWMSRPGTDLALMMFLHEKQTTIYCPVS